LNNVQGEGPQPGAQLPAPAPQQSPQQAGAQMPPASPVGTTQEVEPADRPRPNPVMGRSFGSDRRIKTWMILLAVGIVVLALGFVVVQTSTSGVTYKKLTIASQGADGKPATLSALLVEPAGGVKGKVPGVVFAHGFTGSKEWYIQTARQMAKEGLVVLMIDMRGHGGSTGAATFVGDEAYDVLAAGDYMRKNITEVDPAHIVAMGHSLGGTAVTAAGIIQPDNRFSSVVAIWCWTSWKDALTDLMGPLDSFIGRSWSITPFSKSVDVNSPDSRNSRSIVDTITATKPPNYLLAVGSKDELASVAREEELLEKATAQVRLTGPEQLLKDNFTYGDFANSTARRLMVTEDDHLAELASGPIVRQSIDWIKQGAGIPVAANQGAPFLWGRFLGFALIAVGIMLLILGALSAVRRRLFPNAADVAIAPPWEYPSGRQALDVLVYALPLIAASFLAMPFVKALGLKPFIPYTAVNELSTYYIARTLLLLPFFIALIVVVARRQASAGRLSEQVKDGAARWGRSLGYGLIPVVAAVLVLGVIGGPLLLPRAFARLPLYFFIGIACIGSAFWMEDYLFYKLAYSYLERGEGRKGEWRVIIVRAVILDLILIAALLPLMKGLGVSIHLMFKLPLIVTIMTCVVAFAGMAWLSLRLRRLTGGSLAFALMLTTIAVWFFTGPIGVRGF